MNNFNCRLYLITPPTIDLPAFLPQVEAAFAGGDVACLQLRLKNASDADILHAAKALIPLCHAHDAAFILNDRPDLAATCKADGVHIGQDDGTVAQTRKIVGNDMVIGVSCHDSRHLAMEAGEQGADYVAFGAFHPTTSKNPDYMKRWCTPEADILNWWQTFMTLPCVAIGGMNPQNCKPLVNAGADFIAAIQYVWNHPDGPVAAVKEFEQAIANAYEFQE